MRRNRWPTWLALLSIVILGSYLVVTERLIREIRQSTESHMRIYAQVLQALASPDTESELLALFDLLQELPATLRVQTVALNAEGEPIAARNVPFDADVANRGDWPRLVEYARQLDRQNPPLITATGSIHFGVPPVLRLLRWMPWFQVSGGVIVLLIAAGLMRANMRAEQERMWAAMARELAHQMGTPLSSLSGWVELLRLPPEEREGLATPDQIASHVAADVERLGRVSRRFELIGKTPSLAPVDVASLLTDLEEYLQPRLPRLGTGVSFRARIRGQPPKLLGNQVLLGWALENLVKNALDALAGRGGHIRVVARSPEPGWVQIDVSDNGPGIPPEVRNRIFEPGVTTKSAGWGVGLSLARRIVELYHGGRIGVRPRRGGGTVFEIRLPAERSAGGG